MNADAVKAAAEALAKWTLVGHYEEGKYADFIPDAEVAVAAAEPIIRAAIAAEICRLVDRYADADDWHNPPSGQSVAAKFDALAARIANPKETPDA